MCWLPWPDDYRTLGRGLSSAGTRFPKDQHDECFTFGAIYRDAMRGLLTAAISGGYIFAARCSICVTLNLIQGLLALASRCRIEFTIVPQGCGITYPSGHATAMSF